MKAMIINDFGGADVFETAELPKPELKPGHVLVKVAASSVNPVDYKIRQLGTQLGFAPPLPAVLGMDFAGEVVEVADDVTTFSIGDEAYGCAGGLGELQGSLAEYMLVDVRLAAKKPKNITMAEAAALPLVSITAYEGLVRAGVKAGQRVLVHGGSGGVGHVALQLAKQMGAEVYSTGGGDRQTALITELGGTAINYKAESIDDYVNQYTDGVGFDVVFDSVGNQNIVASMQACKLNGHIATTGSRAEIDLSLAHAKGLSLHVVFMLIPMIHNVGRAAHAEILNTITDLVERDTLKPILSEKTFTLETIAEAHTYLESGQGMGKVVVHCS